MNTGNLVSVYNINVFFKDRISSTLTTSYRLNLSKLNKWNDKFLSTLETKRKSKQMSLSKESNMFYEARKKTRIAFRTSVLL